MKLRIYRNSIRLRLSRNEVSVLAAGGAIEERLTCVPQPLTYRLEPSEVTQMSGTFAQGVLSIHLPLHEVSRWRRDRM